MRYCISWKQWCDWTAEDKENPISELEEELRDLAADNTKVTRFLTTMSSVLNILQLEEINAHMANPNRQTRSYSECLRDLSNRLDSLKPKGGKHV